MQYLTEILSIARWPMTVIILVALFLLLFRKEVAAVITRMKKAKFPGGEVDIQQEPSAEEKEEEKKIIKEKTELMKKIETLEEQLRQKEKTPRKEVLDIVKRHYLLHEQESEEISYWKYEYLDKFLVENSKDMLAFFNRNPDGVTREKFERSARVSSIGPAASESIFKVLLFYNLINEEKGLWKMTNEGKEFLEHTRKKTQRRAAIKALRDEK
jgi:hypothetical protein